MSKIIIADPEQNSESIDEPKILHDYQKFGIATLRNNKRFILADSVGLGKTVQALGASQHPTLIICPSRAIGVWVEEIHKWTNVPDDKIVVYRGTPKKRNILALELQNDMAWFVISTYPMMKEIQTKVSKWWKTIIFDEAHILRNRQRNRFSKGTLYPTAKKFYSYRMYLLTGTPIVNGSQDLWTLLNLIDASNFRSYWKFVNKFCVVYHDDFSTRVEGTNPANAQELNTLLKRYMLRRTPEIVGMQLPPFDRQFIPLQLTSKQEQAYKQLAIESMLFLENEQFILTPNVLSKFTRLRQLLVCPRILGIDDDGASLQALAEETESLDEPIAVFTPFREAIQYIQYVLNDSGYETYTIVGGMDENRIKHNIDLFMSSENPRRAIIATLQMGTSWSIPGVRLSYTIGFDWSIINHEQSEGRLAGGFRRTVSVLSKYFVHNYTIDSHMRSILNEKVTWRELAMNPEKFFRPKSEYL